MAAGGCTRFAKNLITQAMNLRSPSPPTVRKRSGRKSQFELEEGVFPAGSFACMFDPWGLFKVVTGTVKMSW